MNACRQMSKTHAWEMLKINKIVLNFMSDYITGGRHLG